MNIQIRIVLIIFLANFLTSCDPIHNIKFINKSNSEVKIKINLDSKNENYDLEQNAIGDSIVLNIKKDSVKYIEFGIGVWDEKEIIELTKSMKSIEVETKDIKTIYKSKNAMNEILNDNVNGIVLKKNIEIEIK
ncbi:hypothetical protein [Flavobacterium sp. 5]|uniref:hypothetical protein n=1 Tax=Flavobacterium sp. 5 TaxID=2035199 RepID=UPI000C2C0365|nr:hypothetical protein [Flavobacterium sp. 5]PKB15253.1 hypothetical protein CLU82_0317 [Flavobacterium sp. 5]